MTEESKKGRGRPKSEKTVEREAQEAKRAAKYAWLKDAPDYIRDSAELQRMQTWIAAAEANRKEVLRTYKYDAFYPDSQAYAMDSLGDEMLIGHEDKILRREAEFHARFDPRRRKGAQTLQSRSAKNAAALVALNSDLIEKHKRDPRRFSLNRIVQQIHDEWDRVPPGSGRPRRRGLQGDKPSPATIRRWIEKTKIV